MGAFRFKSHETAQRMDLLPPDPAARTRDRQSSPRKPDIIDVEFEIVPAGARRQGYPVYNDNRRPAFEPRHSRSSGLVPGLARRIVMVTGFVESLLQRVSPRGFAALVAGVFATVFLFAVTLAGVHSFAGAPVEAPGLQIAGISTSIDDRDGMPVLSIYGRVVNTGPDLRNAPLILVDVMAGGQRIVTSSLTPQVSTIAAGQSSYFSARLPHSGGKMPEVRVSLAPVDAPAN